MGSLTAHRGAPAGSSANGCSAVIPPATRPATQEHTIAKGESRGFESRCPLQQQPHGQREGPPRGGQPTRAERVPPGIANYVAPKFGVRVLGVAATLIIDAGELAG